MNNCFWRNRKGKLMLKWPLLLAVAILLIPLSGGCGVKTAPYPEAATLPGQVLNLTQTFTPEGELILSWMPPKENMVGRPVKSLDGFAIEMTDDNYCVGCRPKYIQVDLVPLATPPPGLEMAPGPYHWRFKAEPGRVYHFRVTSVARGGGKHPQARAATMVWALKVPGSLSGFRAALGDRSVELAWRGVTGDVKAEFQKREGDGPWQGISGLDPARGHHSDLEVEYGKSYRYRGRLARYKDDTKQPGTWSREIKVRVSDFTPPNPPGYLDVALTSNGVRLNWENLAAVDPEVAGYRVYRQLQGEADFSRLSPVLLRENFFFDPVSLNLNKVARYRVTAVDSSRKANESLPSPVVDVYLEPPVQLQ